MPSFYDTLSRSKKELIPINKDWVGLYTCGPTVYNFAHIGNLRTYIFEDILQRTLEYNNYSVRRVMNITDVGHLTGDTDAGDDKLDRAAQAEKKSVEEIAQFYTDAFFVDLEKLNIKKPDIIAPATKFIREQVAVIETLFSRGFAYDTPTAVYFDVAKFKDYGKLSGQSLAEKSVGAREEVVVDKEKHNAADFALWFKLTGKFKQHLLHWPSPWGEGFPGWHIECSAISRHFLGQPFDIHTGGVDHIGTHHENEIAQSEAAFGTPLANIWIHGEHLLINDGKMAKSEGNFLTLDELEKRGYHPPVFRYLVLGAHYRTKLNFSWESLDAAKNGLNNLYQEYYLLSKSVKDNDPDSPASSYLATTEEDFRDAVNEDLNLPKALASMHQMLSAELMTAKDKLTLLEKFDRILGLKLENAAYQPESESGIAKRIEEYRGLRSSKQFAQSDVLRKEIEDLGYSVRDTERGSYAVKKFF
jgi:cysteinyl-tRNA synthetase